MYTWCVNYLLKIFFLNDNFWFQILKFHQMTNPCGMLLHILRVHMDHMYIYLKKYLCLKVLCAVVLVNLFCTICICACALWSMGLLRCKFLCLHLDEKGHVLSCTLIFLINLIKFLAQNQLAWTLIIDNRSKCATVRRAKKEEGEP